MAALVSIVAPTAKFISSEQCYWTAGGKWLTTLGNSRMDSNKTKCYTYALAPLKGLNKSLKCLSEFFFKKHKEPCMFFSGSKKYTLQRLVT